MEQSISIHEENTAEARKEKKINKGEGKIFLFFLILFLVAIAMAGFYVIHIFDREGFLSDAGMEQTLYLRNSEIAHKNAKAISEYVVLDQSEAAIQFCKNRNIGSFRLMDLESGKVLFQYDLGENYTSDTLYTDKIEDIYGNMQKYELCLLNNYSHEDAYKGVFRMFILYRQWIVPIFVLVGCCLLATLILTPILFCKIGYVRGKEEVTENYFTRIPLEVVTIPLALLIMLEFGACIDGMGFSTMLITLYAVGVLIFLWMLNFAHRIKLGKMNSLVFRFFQWAFYQIKNIFDNMPLIWKNMITLLGVGAVELFVIIAIAYPSRLSRRALLILCILCILEKFVLGIFHLSSCLMFKKLMVGGREIASGNTAYRIDTFGMTGDYKKHGENLNSISNSVAIAVKEQLKSERMKTELVANVSHDIKTPLTSVINYSDLIQNETQKLSKQGTITSEELNTIEEYSGVLNRQSNRLKRLLDDLVDISKANSGSMEITLEKLEIGTFLSQVVGEYENRFQEKNLEIIISKTKEEVFFEADSRKLFRVFDNLMQNIYKYAHPGTRVYIDAEKLEDQLYVQFRNTSHERINKTPEELLERFSRGDESRHKEGNGLGLAIAKSLMELQGGEMKVEVDGDLFKVILSLKICDAV